MRIPAAVPFVFVVLILAAPVAMADVLTFNCSPGPYPIADDGYDGSLASMACCTIPVVRDGDVVAATANLSVAHTWVGDLTVKIASPAGSVATMMSRPGLDELTDDGSDCCGNGTPWVLAPVDFDDNGGGPSAEMMGIDGLEVCTEDGFCSYVSDTGAAPGAGLVDFEGDAATGDWQCCVGDSALQDEGGLAACSVSLKVAALSVFGSCPGEVTIEASAMMPDGNVALLIGSAPGSFVVPSGPCAGTEIGLDGVSASRVVTADGEGRFNLVVDIPGGACGRYVQAIDVTTCASSPVTQFPQ